MLSLNAVSLQYRLIERSELFVALCAQVLLVEPFCLIRIELGSALAHLLDTECLDELLH